MSAEFNSNDYIVYFKTDHIDELKILFETMQKLKTDSFIIFYKGTIDKPGKIEIKDTDTNQVILYKLIIPQQNLKEYYCSEDIYTINLDFACVSKILKIMTEYYEISFSILKCKEQELCINAYTKDMSQVMKSRINLSPMDHETINDLSLNFNCKIKVNTANFHAKCKSLSTFGDFLNITCDKEALTLSVQDSETSRISNETSFNTVNSSSNKSAVHIEFDKNYLINNPMPVIKSTYSASNIIHFDKLKSLSQDLDIRISVDNEPLCLIYEIKHLGIFVVFIVAIDHDNE